MSKSVDCIKQKYPGKVAISIFAIFFASIITGIAFVATNYSQSTLDQMSKVMIN